MMSSGHIKPYLFIGNSKDDGEAMRLLQYHGVDCYILIPPQDEETPALLENLREYEGLEEIKRYIRKKIEEK